ncbi:hypothetical protein SAMN05216591_2100 [Pseudomonas extremaustralis]|uniref:Uncharacterized protein n=2 Tax=Pseudomonas extremaustralis TaxID=359110 RepID=A0ABY0N9E4_9PSED|nr:hypothetical protein SAMN05216591_2100 [Pseudomonas extremaustralis]
MHLRNLKKMANKMVYGAFLLLVLFSCKVFAGAPQFSDYKVEYIYEGRNSHLAITDSAGPRWDDLRISAAEKPVNFAGHYILFTGDCAGASVCGEVIDAETGKIIRSLPNVYQAYDEDTEEAFDIEYKVDSRLVVIMGIAQNNEPGINNESFQRMYRTRYYEFNDGDFHLIFTDDN